MGRREIVLVVVLPIIIVGSILGYELLQRAAISGCQFKLDRVEVRADFPTENMLQEVVPPLLLSAILGPPTPLESVVQALLPISSSLNLEKVIVRFLQDTTLTFDFYVRITNPSIVNIIIDKADIRITVNDYYLGTVQIPSSYNIPPGTTQVVPITGLQTTLRDLASTAMNILQANFLVHAKLDLTSHMKTLFSVIDVEGTLIASCRLIPKPPSVIASLDSMSGACQVSFHNADSMPMEGDALVYVLQQPALPTDIGFINWLRPKVEELQKWTSRVSLEPGEDESLQISGIMFKPNAPNVVIVLWKPLFDVIPYQVTAQFGFLQTSSSGMYRVQSLQTTRNVIYLLTQNFGYLGQHVINPYAAITDTYWLDDQNDKVSTASKGESITGVVSLSTNMGGTLKLSARKDMALATDVEWQSASFQVSKSTYQAAISFQFDPSERYGNDLQECRGYYLKVELNGYPIYETENRYPPRLGLSRPTINDAYWTVDGIKTTSTESGISITAHVVLTADSGSVRGTLTLEIRKDLALLPDRAYLLSNAQLNLRKGETNDFTMVWTPDEASGFILRGYFLRVLYEGDKIYEMESSYPPRLRVEGGTPGKISVNDSYWIVSGQRASSAGVGDTVEADVVVRAEDGPVSGNLVVKVRKDMALALDTDFTQSSFSVNLKEGESTRLYFTWNPDEPSSGSLRGYYLEIWLNGEKVQTMGNSYPPRLKVIIASQGTPQVVDAYWKIGSTRVTTAKVNDKVEAHVTIRAIGGPLEGYVTVRIRKDIVLLPDTDYLVQTFQISVSNGEETDISLTFYPDESSTGFLRGYFIEVNLTTWNQEWTMDGSYPPRLKVS